ncbi:duf28 domain-containing protein [Xylariaceae sp. FL0804]|nr:duf28 domain-containing protein [Xylariaceae sp. FL0804]
MMPFLPSSAASAHTPLAICARCFRLQQQRLLHTGQVLRAGHNKWSKIKHQKGAADVKKASQRTLFAKNLLLYTKLYGADPKLNSQLALAIAQAKKAGMPKANIDAAIARGQGRSPTGQSLEAATLEVMLPGSVALVVDIETDHKQRALLELRPIVKKGGGTVTPTAFRFTRLGRATLRPPPPREDQYTNSIGSGSGGDSGGGDHEGTNLDFDDVMMRALDAGAEDVEPDAAHPGGAVLQTRPDRTHGVAQAAARALGLDVAACDIVWACTSARALVGGAAAAEQLAALLAALHEHPDVQAVWTNAERGPDVPDELWDAVEEHIST